jgi:peptidyl-prolyl cis-trans isomerase A (cyclophilin A)
MLKQQWKISAGFEKTESGLRYNSFKEEKEKQAVAGKTVSVHYEGSLESGKV